MKHLILSLLLFTSITANAAGKLQNEDFKSAAELVSAGGTAAQLLNITKIWDTINGMQLSASISGGLLGGGGGGSLVWTEAASAPIASLDSANNRTYLYQSGLAQGLNTYIKVPATYGGGTQIKMYVQFYDPDSSGTALLQSVSTLIRAGTDVYTSATNQRTSTNTAVTLGGGTVNIPQTVTLDLTSTSGQINGVNVAANSIIYINLKRGTDTGTSDIVALPYTAEVVTH